MKLSHLFLEIAGAEFELLRRTPGDIVLGDDELSPHFRHAFVTSLFSAFAVEHAITELVWIRCLFQTEEPHRSLLLRYASRLRGVDEMARFLRLATTLDDGLIAEIRKLLEYRNSKVHLRATDRDGSSLDFEDIQRILAADQKARLDVAIQDLTREREDSIRALVSEFGVEATTSLTLPGISTQDIDVAEGHLTTAKKALEALQKEIESPNWPLVK